MADVGSSVQIYQNANNPSIGLNMFHGSGTNGGHLDNSVGDLYLATATNASLNFSSVGSGGNRMILDDTNTLNILRPSSTTDKIKIFKNGDANFEATAGNVIIKPATGGVYVNTPDRFVVQTTGFNLIEANVASKTVNFNSDAINQLTVSNSSDGGKTTILLTNTSRREIVLGTLDQSSGSSVHDYAPYIYSSKNPPGSRDLGAVTGNTGYWLLGDDNLKLYTKSIIPQDTGVHTVGRAGRFWSEVFATNGTINTSDVRTKEQIVSSPLGLNFINLLRPVNYKWKDSTFPSMPDENGNTTQITLTHHRKHYGLIAQEVKTVLDNLNVSTEDFAGYVYDSETDSYALRYTEFVAPLIKAVQELSTRLTAAEATITALQSA
jgi:hypothetical protein